MWLLRRILLILFLLIAAGITLFFLFRDEYLTIISTLAQTQVKNITSDLINDAIDKQISNGIIQYKSQFRGMPHESLQADPPQNQKSESAAQRSAAHPDGDYQ